MLSETAEGIIITIVVRNFILSVLRLNFLNSYKETFCTQKNQMQCIRLKLCIYAEIEVDTGKG